LRLGGRNEFNDVSRRQAGPRHEEEAGMDEQRYRIEILISRTEASINCRSSMIV
jgi:hypothetical protein